MSQDEAGWPLPPETADHLRSLDIAQASPKLDADFSWEPQSGSIGMTFERVARGELELPYGVMLAAASSIYGGVAAVIALAITGILGSLGGWQSVMNWCALVFFSGVVLSLLIMMASIIFMAGQLPRTIAGFSVRSLTRLAALLAGREGLALLWESDDHLAGDGGHDSVSWAKVLEAVGFAVAGARYRGQQWADAAWKPAEFVLRSRFLSGLLVLAPTVVDAFEVLTHKGTMTVLTSFSSIFGVGVALAAAVRFGRKYRGIELPDPKPRRAGNDDQDT